MFKLFKRDPVKSLVKELKNRPNEMFVNSEYMAVYSPVLEKAIIIPGNYMSLTDEEANLVLQNRLTQIASTN